MSRLHGITFTELTSDGQTNKLYQLAFTNCIESTSRESVNFTESVSMRKTNQLYRVKGINFAESNAV